MLKHIVMWKLKHDQEHDRAENALLAKTYLEDLAGKIKEIRKIEVGINVNESAGAYDLVLYSEFENEQDLEAYQNHPDHLKVGEFIGQIRESRVVVDYVIA